MTETVFSSEALERFTNRHAAIMAEMEEAKAKMREAAKAAINEVVANFFNAFPEVRTIHWTQYTPHFNDGEPCVFGLNEIYFSPREHDALSSPYDGEDAEPHERDFNAWGRKPKPSPTLKKAMDQVMCMFGDMEEFLQEAYGDGYYVQIHRNGVETSEYDHDYYVQIHRNGVETSEYDHD